MLLGARFVCPRCGLRGPAAACPSCGAARLDLAAEGARERLREAWPMAEAWERGLSVLSPRAIRLHRPLVALAGLASLSVALGTPILAATNGESPGAAAAMVCVSAPMAVALVPFFAVFFFAYAHVLRLIALLAGLLAAVLPLGRARLGIVGWLTGWLAGKLSPIVALDEEPPTPLREGRLASPAVVRTHTDGLAWLSCADAWAEPFEVELDGARLRVEPTHGALRFAGSWYADVAEGRATAQVVDEPPPAWLATPRARRVRRSDVPAGRPVRVGGGVVTGGALVGTPEAPVTLEIG